MSLLTRAQKDGKLPGDQDPVVVVAPNPFAALGGNTNEIGGGVGLLRKPSAAERSLTFLFSHPGNHKVWLEGPSGV